MATRVSARTVLKFWFTDHGEEQWFTVDPAFDALLAERFAETHARAAAGELFAWRKTPEGRLAEIIVLDQFSRQLHRGSARAYETDPMALVLAQEAVAGGHDEALEPRRRMFVYMPYMHSESLEIHKQALRLMRRFGNQNLLDFEKSHYALIERFGRFPMRNAALGRASTPEEEAYIAEREGKMF